MAPGRVKTQTCLLWVSGHPGRSREEPPLLSHLWSLFLFNLKPPAALKGTQTGHLPSPLTSLPDPLPSSNRPAVFPISSHGPLGFCLPPHILQSVSLGLTFHGHLPGSPAPHAQIAPLPLHDALPHGLAGTRLPDADSSSTIVIRSAGCSETVSEKLRPHKNLHVDRG